MRLLAMLCLLTLALAACDSGGSNDNPTPDTNGPEEDAVRIDATATPDVVGADQAQEVAVVPEVVPETVPEGPQPPAPMLYSGGKCPHLQSGTNSIESAGRMRSFELYLPTQVEAGAPLVFIWHGNGDTPKNIGLFFEAQKTAENNGAILVAPSNCCGDGLDECCNIAMTWNMGEYDPTEADLTLFDDLLSCIDQQYDIDNERVYTTGFSAGSLWSTYLVVNRSAYFAAAAIFSGGTGLVVDYVTPEKSMPLLLSWGGEPDVYMGVVDFNEMMQEFSVAAQADGHFVVECNHGLGHTMPYGAPSWAYDFLFMHTWQTTASPFRTNGLSPLYPDYCTIPAN